MRVTTHLLQEFIDISSLDIKEVCRALDHIGLEVELLHKIELPQKVVVGKVLEKEQHPDADKLSVCRVDVGNEVLQIVCGAKNVQINQYVAVALEGAILGSKDKELMIKPSKLRGIDSFGMLCSSSELGLPLIYDGIMILDESIGGDLILGKELREYPLFQGYDIEISLTPNRGDCLCIIGIAREIRAYFGLSIQKPKEYISTNQIGIGRKMQVALKGRVDSSLIYKVVDFNEKFTPLKIALSLGRIGCLKSSVISNFITYTTYITGVILNAYGADELHRQYPNEILWLNVQKDKLGFDEVSCFDQPLSKVGIGNCYQQDLDQNHSVIFEASYISPVLISKLLFDHKKQENDREITYRTARGSNPDLHFGINFLCLVLSQYSDCFIYDEIQENKQDREKNIIHTQFSNIAQIIGYEIDREEASNILKRLGFLIEVKNNSDSFSVIAPPYRHDIQTQQDLSEEILRIYGVDNIPSKPYLTKDAIKITPSYLDYKNQRDLIKRALALGFCECIHYLFYQKQKLQKLGFETLNQELDLINPITSELDTLRTSLLPAMLDTIQRNQNYGYKNIKICEIGSVYDQNRNEKSKFALMVSGLQKQESYPLPKGEKWDFYSFSKVVSDIIGHFELISYQSQNLPLIFHPHQCAMIVQENKTIGLISKLHPSVAKEMELSDVFMCEIDLSELNRKHQTFKDFSRLPRSQRDLTILISKDIAFDCIRKEILKHNIFCLQNLYPLDIYQQSENEIALSIRFDIAPKDKSLRDEDLQMIMQEILSVLEREFGARLKV